MDRINYWIVSLLLSQSIFAKDLSNTIKVKRLYLETEQRISVNREYYMKDEQAAKYDVNLGLDLEFPATFYYNNKVVSTTDDNQFRFVGLNFEVGARPFNGIDLYIQHFSGHALDESYNRDFPQRNKIGVRFNLINN